jgi:hypothetical protein
MRTVFLLPLTAVVVVVAGCGTEGRESAALSPPQRDLTLAAQAPEVEIASPIELQQLRTQYRAVRRSPRIVQTAPKVIFASVATPAPVLAAPTPVAQPATTASEPANDRELLPGKTVTVIPASSGPSAGSDGTDEVPAIKGRPMVRGGGGTCRGRGRGPGGIAGVPRPDFR